MASPPADDYYAVLGVDAGADGAALRRAWRRLAARWHPDRAGESATRTFQRLSAAYAVLSDPVARAAYDRRRALRTAPPARARESSPHAATATAAAAAARTAREPAPAVMLERLCGWLGTLITCGAASLDDDDGDGKPRLITLVLRPAEAAQGGMATISLRVAVRCPDCASPGGPAGPTSSSSCARCGGAGAVEELFSAWLAVPPGVAAGEVLAPSVELPGMIEPVRFRIRLAAS